MDLYRFKIKPEGLYVFLTNTNLEKALGVLEGN